MLTLTIERSGPLGGGTHTVSGRSITIGRAEGNDIVLDVSHISSRHAAIRFCDGRYLLSDLESTNGSMVQRKDERIILGSRGQPEVQLRSGDLLVLGDIDNAVRLRVSLSEPGAEKGRRQQSTIVASRAGTLTQEVNRRMAADPSALKALYDLVGAINPLTERDRILSQVSEAVLQAIPGAADVLLLAPDPTSGELVVQAEAHLGEGLSRRPHPEICARVLTEHEALLFGLHDASAIPAHTLVSQGVGGGIAAPLWQAGRASGVLQINCAAGRYELHETHLDLAVVLAHHAAMALERADLVARLQAAESRLREENVLLRRRIQPEAEMVCNSPAMARVLEDLRKAAASDVTVLLLGETGTGKELAARFIHNHSRRREGLLVPVNCGALSETLLDSELFGYRKGAFTGAAADRKGVFEVAAGGTVFLDEIGETPASVQVRLLRVLEEGKVKVLGEPLERRVDIRLIAATNCDLARLVEEGGFRRDLYYRLRVFPVTLPPLRERPEEIEPLCQLFARRFARQMGKRIGGVDPSLVQALRRYSFPGNVRELANEMERAVVRADPGQVLTADVLSEEVLGSPPPASPTDRPRDLRQRLAEVERQIIVEALKRHGGRKAEVARELCLTRQGLVKKMERLGI